MGRTCGAARTGRRERFIRSAQNSYIQFQRTATNCAIFNVIIMGKTLLSVIFLAAAFLVTDAIDEFELFEELEMMERAGGIAQKWTGWQNRDSPTMSGDYETIESAKKRYRDMCDDPVEIQCEVFKDGRWQAYTAANQLVVCNTVVGGVCKNTNNGPGEWPTCLNYRVRYNCAKVATRWTGWQNRDRPTYSGDWETVGSAVKAYSDMCEEPLDIECQVRLDNEWKSFDDGKQVVTCNKIDGFICKNADNPGSGVTCLDYRVRFKCLATA